MQASDVGSPGARAPVVGAYVSDYVKAVSRHRWLFVSVVVAGMLALPAIGTALPRTYTAWASVLVTPTKVQDPNPAEDRAPSGIDLDTELQLALSSRVSTAVAKAMGTTPGDASSRIVAVVPPNSRVLRLGYISQSPVIAEQGADAAAAAYLADRGATAHALLDASIERLTNQQANLARQIHDAEANLGQKGQSIGQLTASKAHLSTLVKQQSNAALNLLAAKRLTPTPGSILSAATVPTQPNGQGRKEQVAAGLFVGIVLGALFVGLVERRPRRLNRASDVRDVLGRGVPVIERDRVGRAPSARLLAGTIVSWLPDGGTVELRAAGTRHDLTVALDTATSLASSGFKVVVAVWPGATTDERGPGVRPAPGVSDLLLDRPATVTGEQPAPGVWLVGPGVSADDLVTHVTDAQNRRRLARVRGYADYLLALTPPADGTEAVGVLGGQADLLVPVARRRRTRLADVVSTRPATRRGRSRTAAVVVLGRPSWALRRSGDTPPGLPTPRPVAVG